MLFLMILHVPLVAVVHEPLPVSPLLHAPVTFAPETGALLPLTTLTVTVARHRLLVVLTFAPSRSPMCMTLGRGVFVGVGVLVATGVFVGVDVLVGMGVFVGVSVGVAVFVAVAVGPGVLVGVAVAVGPGAVSYTHLTLPTSDLV